MAQPHVADLLERVSASDVLQEAIAIQQIPAPTFHEGARADYVLKRLSGRGFAAVARDEIHNVFARLPGAEPARPALLIAAHTDTVFDHDTDLTVQHQEGRVCGPGLGDNSLGVAALLALADAFAASDHPPLCDMWFIANVREEGLGDLGGMRAVMARLGDRLGAAIILEGMGLGRVCRGGIAVRRYKITCTGEGGHSWTHFGRRSAIHELMRLGARLTDLHMPDTQRATFNIGLVEGGTSINTIASEASLYLDLRAERAEELAALEAQVHALVDETRASGAPCTITRVGDRPPGQLACDHWLVQSASAALEAVGITPTWNLASTDANAVLSAGVPAVTLGITHGENAHRTDECVMVAPIALGVRQAMLVALMALARLATA